MHSVVSYRNLEKALVGPGTTKWQLSFRPPQISVDAICVAGAGCLNGSGDINSVSI